MSVKCGKIISKHLMWNPNAEQRVLYTIFAIGQDHFSTSQANASNLNTGFM